MHDKRHGLGKGMGSLLTGFDYDAQIENVVTKTIGEKEEKPKEPVVVEKPAEKKPAEKAKDKDKSDVDALFEKLAQPRIKKAVKDKSRQLKEEITGYHQSERSDLDRLIESVE